MFEFVNRLAITESELLSGPLRAGPVPGRESAPADPASAAAVARVLLGYLEPRLEAGELAFAEAPEEIQTGWETYIYRCRLRGRRPLPRPFDRRLVLRLYASPQGVPRACHEFAVQRALFRAGYPVPEPLLVEEDCGSLGGPFLIMECLPGETLLDHLRGHSMHVLWVAAQLAEQQVRLHRLPPEDVPAPPGPFLERRLEELRDLVNTYGLDGLAAGLGWLRARRAAEPASPCVVHLDYHPINVLVHEGRPPGVVDWSEADVGDRHADVATTLLLMYTVAVAVTCLRERLLAPLARWVLIRNYLRVYGRRLRLEPGTLRYYLAWTALRRLAVAGMWLRGGPHCHGCKPSAVGHLKTVYLERLQEVFRRCTGVPVRLA
jgi:aminoglycoside phosphotransferase (APT) family kinase protein